MARSVADWLRWQETLNPAEIDLGLDRVRTVAARLDLSLPAHRIVIAGTNGKGSTAAFVERFLRNGYRTGLYTSPHLIDYNERIRVQGQPVDDAELIAAFEAVDTARRGVPLTYFEFGTLAALIAFSCARCSAWVLEVGLGGRLDAVNAVDPTVSVITTIGLDHQDWLGQDLESIATEKAGILRKGVPAVSGEAQPPAAMVSRADELGIKLRRLGGEHKVTSSGHGYTWQGQRNRLDFHLDGTPFQHQLDNLSTALAAVELADSDCLPREESIGRILAQSLPPARCQLIPGRPRWLVDVGHNEQAAFAIGEALAFHGRGGYVVCLVGMMADKDPAKFAGALDPHVNTWVTCTIDGDRGLSGEVLATMIGPEVTKPVLAADCLEVAMQRAISHTPPDGLVVVCGSFHIAGPALQMLLPRTTVL